MKSHRGRIHCNACGARMTWRRHHPEGSAYASPVWMCDQGHPLVWTWAPVLTHCRYCGRLLEEHPTLDFTEAAVLSLSIGDFGTPMPAVYCPLDLEMVS